MSRRAKIVCTLGPATADRDAIRALVDAGMDVARLNFSHGDPDEHAAFCRHVREAADAVGRAVGVMADLPGPKIRLGTFKDGRAELADGAEWVISTEPVEGDAARASTTYDALARDVRPGDTLLVDDGRIRLEAIASDGREVRCRVVHGGTVSNHKGLNLPGVRISAPTLSERDAELLRFALTLPVDFVAMSFVRDPADAESARRVMDEAGVRVPLIAKIEKPEAVKRIEAIVEAFDGIMVARGDLGVEMPLEQVPLVQKRAIQLAREHAKPAIVATQMLDSMIEAARPTRAEASDVANAVFDGADALMLSGETSIGRHARAAVATMARIIEASEEGGGKRMPRLESRPASRQEALALAAVRVTHDLPTRALVAFTTTGSTARRIASHRGSPPLLAFTTSEAVRRQLTLVWGTETFVVPFADHTDAMIVQVDEALLRLGRARREELAVILAGTPPGLSGTTNTMRLHRIGSLSPAS